MNKETPQQVDMVTLMNEVVGLRQDIKELREILSQRKALEARLLGLPEDREFVTVTEACMHLGVSRSRVRQLKLEGRLDAIKVGNLLYIDKESLDNFKPLPSGPRKST